MIQQGEAPAQPPLAPDDLELLEKFLVAWCEENGVDRRDEAAADVASALIDWYRLDPKFGKRLKPTPDEDLPKSPEIQILLQKMA